MNIKIALLSIVMLSTLDAREPFDFARPITNRIRAQEGIATYTTEEFSNVDNLYGALKNKLDPLKTAVIFDIDVLEATTLATIKLLQEYNFEVIISSAFYTPYEAHTRLTELKADKILNGELPEETTSSLTSLSKHTIKFYQDGLLCLATPQKSPSPIYSASILTPAAKSINLYLKHIVMVSSFAKRKNFIETQLTFVKDSAVFANKDIIFATINPNIQEELFEVPSQTLEESPLSPHGEESNDSEMLFDLDL